MELKENESKYTTENAGEELLILRNAYIVDRFMILCMLKEGV